MTATITRGDLTIAAANPPADSHLEVCPVCCGFGENPMGIDEEPVPCDVCDGHGSVPKRRGCELHRFTGNERLAFQACAQRSNQVLSRLQRAAYADAHTAGHCLTRIFDKFDAEDHRTVRWAMIAGLVRHIAGRRS